MKFVCINLDHIYKTNLSLKSFKKLIYKDRLWREIYLSVERGVCPFSKVIMVILHPIIFIISQSEHLFLDLFRNWNKHCNF